MALADKKCVPCEGGVPKLGSEQIARHLSELRKWEVREDRLQKSFWFTDFVGAIGFVNKMAEVAESQGHHPDFCVHFNHLQVTLWTHAIDGLSENDFILAAKLDAIEGK